MLDTGESPILIIIMLTRYFTTLWKLYDLRRRGNTELANAVGVNPYFLKDYSAALQHYTVGELEHAFELMANADEQLKSTPLNPAQVMQNMLVYLMNPRELVNA